MGKKTAMAASVMRGVSPLATMIRTGPMATIGRQYETVPRSITGVSRTGSAIRSMASTSARENAPEPSLHGGVKRGSCAAKIEFRAVHGDELAEDGRRRGNRPVSGINEFRAKLPEDQQPKNAQGRLDPDPGGF